MKAQIYITDDERIKCQKIADAFAELEKDDIMVLDAGRFGFVKLQYYTFLSGFEVVVTFTDSQTMFEDLWEEWFHTQLILLGKAMNVGDIYYDDIFNRLPKKKKKELMKKRSYFIRRSKE